MNTKIQIMSSTIICFLILTTFSSAIGTSQQKSTSTSRDYKNYGLLVNIKDDHEDPPPEGYTLFAPIGSTTTYLINGNGKIVHTWLSTFPPGLSAYLLEDGRLLRGSWLGVSPTFGYLNGIGGGVEMFDWDGARIWNFKYSNKDHCLTHDIEMLPNGNILMIAYEYKHRNEAIAAGRNPNLLSAGELWPDHIIEVEPTLPEGGNIVWEWHVWDHLIQDYDSTKENYGVVGNHPELIDINYVGSQSYYADNDADWTHTNSIDYNEKFDQILLSVNFFNEIWIIDHSTTAQEAAGHTGGNVGKGGDLLYRWGNPQTYRAGTKDDQNFFKQHDAQWIEPGCPGEGNIIVFNNGFRRPEGEYSSIDEIVPPVDANGNYALTFGSAFGPDEPIWRYTAENPTDFYSYYMSGVQRLPDGNTLICCAVNGYFFEINSEKEVVWEYKNPYYVPLPANMSDDVFKVRRYYQDLDSINKQETLIFSKLSVTLLENWPCLSRIMQQIIRLKNGY